MADYRVGQRFGYGEAPDDLADWCNENEATIADTGEGWEVVGAPDEVHAMPPDPAPTREELAAAVAEIGDMVASQEATNEMVLDALAELGDAVAELAERGA